MSQTYSSIVNMVWVVVLAMVPKKNTVQRDKFGVGWVSPPMNCFLEVVALQLCEDIPDECISSLVAVQQACKALQALKCDDVWSQLDHSQEIDAVSAEIGKVSGEPFALLANTMFQNKWWQPLLQGYQQTTSVVKVHRSRISDIRMALEVRQNLDLETLTEFIKDLCLFSNELPAPALKSVKDLLQQQQQQNWTPLHEAMNACSVDGRPKSLQWTQPVELQCSCSHLSQKLLPESSWTNCFHILPIQ